MTAYLIKTDKNGTKYWKDDVCPKCNGSGYINYYSHVAAGVCFLCGGSGFHTTTWKEMTPEYAQKLADKRLAKMRAKADERNKNFFKSIGFSEDGKAWVVAGKTYEIKEQLKEAGAKFCAGIGWHFDHEVSEYTCFEISIEMVGQKGIDDAWFLLPISEIENVLREFRNTAAPKTASEYVGNIGDKLTLKVKLVDEHAFQTNYGYHLGYTYILRFVDEVGNTIIWKTSSFTDCKKDNKYIITGKVKDHIEYIGDKQTVLTRCKLIEA